MINEAVVSKKPDELEAVKTELKNLDVIGYDSYGHSSIDAVKSTISSLKKYDEMHPPHHQLEQIREIALQRRKG